MLVGFLATTTGLSVGYHVVAAMRIYGYDYPELKVVGISCRCLYLLMFTMISLQWAKLSIKIINKKRENQINNLNEEDFSKKQLLVILWVFALSFILCFHHFNLVIGGIFEMF